MKKSELLQLAIDKHLVMRWEDRDCLYDKSVYLCVAVSIAYEFGAVTFVLVRDTREIIQASIGNYVTFENYLSSNGANIRGLSRELPKEQFEFIQFLRKKHAEFLIQQLQAKGE